MLWAVVISLCGRWSSLSPALFASSISLSYRWPPILSFSLLQVPTHLKFYKKKSNKVVTVTCVVCLEYFSPISLQIIRAVIRCYLKITSFVKRSLCTFLLQVCRASGPTAAETCVPCCGRKRGGRQMEVNIRALDIRH